MTTHDLDRVNLNTMADELQLILPSVDQAFTEGMVFEGLTREETKAEIDARRRLTCVIEQVREKTLGEVNLHDLVTLVDTIRSLKSTLDGKYLIQQTQREGQEMKSSECAARASGQEAPQVSNAAADRVILTKETKDLPGETDPSPEANLPKNDDDDWDWEFCMPVRQRFG